MSARRSGLAAACALVAASWACLPARHEATASHEPPAALADRRVPLTELACPPPPEAERPEGLVAGLSVAAPARSPFVLHGTLPVPRGAFELAEGMTPFAVLGPAPERTAVPAQVDVVARYPTGEPEVIELLASVELPEGVDPGSPLRYDVILASGTLAPSPPVRPSVALLLDPAGPGPLLLRTRDVFGNVYEADLRGTASHPGYGDARVLKSGPAARQRRHYATLVPVGPPAPEGREPLPHLMGVHAYLTEWADDDRVSLELRVHNGATSGSAERGRLDVPIGGIYWDRLELVVPESWTVQPLARDPFFGEPRVEEDEGVRVVPLVRAGEEGTLHWMGPQAQFHRRLTLVPVSDAQGASPFHEGLAFCTAAPGLWSWFAAGTERYFPQRSLLSTWEGYTDQGRPGHEALRAELRGEETHVRRLLEEGGADGHFVVSGVLGWAHPWFHPAQGTTGGVGIRVLEGERAAACASADGYRLLELEHRMNASRQPEAAWNARGEPVGYHAWLDGQGRIPFDFRTNGRVVPPEFRLPAEGGPPASAQVRAVAEEGRRPAYDAGTPHEAGGTLPRSPDALLAWWPHDGQHLVRYTKNTKALVWLGNDALARDDLILSAELFHLMFHESPHVRASWSPGVTLAIYEEQVREHPGRGANLGRDQAWGIDAMCAAYSVADDAWRSRNRAWFDRVARLLLDAAMPCGVIQRNPYPKILGHDRYDAAQTYETLFLLHAVRGICESVLRGVDDALRAELEELQLRTLDYLYWGPVWSEEGDVSGPRTAFAVAPRGNPAAPLFCDAEGSPIPPDGFAGGVEFFHCWWALEYGYRASGGTGGPKNRYLARALDCWSGFRSLDALVSRFHAETSRYAPTSNAGNWAGFVGLLENL